MMCLMRLLGYFLFDILEVQEERPRYILGIINLTVHSYLGKLPILRYTVSWEGCCVAQC